MTPVTKDRRQALRNQTKLNGIDFVRVHESGAAADRHAILYVYFINAPEPDLRDPIPEVTITRAGTSDTLAVENPTWEHVSGQLTLRLRVTPPGDSATYTLAITSPSLDPFFDRASFSFTAGSPVDVDCATPPTVCPPSRAVMPRIDYLAKDFLSFRQALLDFSALTYPEWQERDEPDFGMMFMEALCGLADDLSYMQDRVAAEAHLATATQRRSLIRLARLLDYEPAPNLAASVQLQFDVLQNGTIPAGLEVYTQSPNGPQIFFATGTGLADKSLYPVRANWSRGRIQPYFIDQSDACLPVGSTQMWVEGTGFGFTAGQPLLIETSAASPADLPQRQLVHLVAIGRETTDPLYNMAITQITWIAADALTQACDLTRTLVIGNLVPATEGQSGTDVFAIDTPPASSPDMPVAIWRTGPNHTSQYLYSLQNRPLVWLAQSNPTAQPLPEIQLTAVSPLSGAETWTWYQRLLDAPEFASAFTLDAALFRNITTSGETPVSLPDYDSDTGDTLRFGDDVFGSIPASGTVFTVNYRVGGGSAGNVAPDAINAWDRQNASAAAVQIQAVTNPFQASGGADPESAASIRLLAPQAYRTRPLLRAVTPEDYEAAAETLSGVGYATATIQWTGSWLTVFTSAQPVKKPASPYDRLQLIDLLNRYRLAGYESIELEPQTVAMDLVITAQASPGAAHVATQKAIADAVNSFLAPGNFFGTPLQRAALLAVVQVVPGVMNVLSVKYRLQGITNGFAELPQTIQIGKQQSLQLSSARVQLEDSP
ncbi:MAG TPA: baseplate J/gp47 family protein [Chthonomonadaceae bacterium]|nr:baseplate J/gp47 family protein [Chthonomonadaceae bacterium]